MSRREFGGGPVGLAIGGACSAPLRWRRRARSTARPATAAPASQRRPTSAATDRMHQAMAIEPSGDVDLDFVRSMIPHHQGAIDMAPALLAASEDPELRKLAEEIIAAQEKEIAFLRSWLQKKGEKSG